jgi:hypothetical protein
VHIAENPMLNGGDPARRRDRMAPRESDDESPCQRGLRPRWLASVGTAMGDQ